MKKSHQ